MTSREDLENSKPTPDQFKTKDEFEEAYGYWMGHQGRVLGMTSPSKDSPAASTSEEDDE